MPRVGGPGSRIPLTELRGKEIKPEEKVVSTKSHEITMATDSNSNLGWVPDFKLERRSIKDPEAKTQIFDVSNQELSEIKTADDFQSKLTELLGANKAFLAPAKADLFEKLPEGEKTNFAYINITGQRTEQAFGELVKILSRTGLSGAEAKDSRKALNLAHRDAYHGRDVKFDRADTKSYWSYGKDAPFVHVFEKMLDSLDKDDPKRAFIQNQIDFVFTHKFVDSGKVDENNAEKTIGLMTMSKDSRHVVSMKKGAENSNSVAYETLQVPAQPAGDHAGKFVYRDGDKHFFEGTNKEVPADLIGSLKSETITDVVLRRVVGDEQPRENFRYDWNGNRMLDVDKINTGWWGHCDIKATMETILTDMKGSAGVTEFRSASGTTTEYSKEMQLEALAAMLNFDDIYLSTQNRGSVRLGETEFAGARWDKRPTKMTLKTDSGQSLDLNVRLSTLSKKGDASETVSLDKVFATKIADDKNESFKENKDILRVEEGDMNFIDGSGRAIKGQIDGYTFDERGRPVEAKTDFLLDLDNVAPDAEKIMIGSELNSIQERKASRYYLDPHTKEISLVSVQFEEVNGKYEAKEGAAKKLGSLQGVELGREMQANDDLEGKLGMLNEVVRSGGKIATDSDTREEVWNGEVNSVRLDTEWRSDDGQWERIGVKVNATFGANKVGTILNKLDGEGNVIDSLELKAAVDFYWKDRPRIAPLVSERGNWFVNKSMHERGVLSLENTDMMSSLGAIQDLSDLIYLGLKEKDNKKMYTIVHEGKRLVYSDKAVWEADVKKLKPDDAPATPATPAPNAD
jgi:hypothetical protein